MVASPLVEPTIEDGSQFVGELDLAGFSVPAAFWLYSAELDSWRLIIASPLVDKLGPRETYRRLQKVLASHAREIKLQDISVVSPNEQIVRLLSLALKTGPGLAKIRFTGNTIDSVHIDDAYIYRLT